LWPTWSSRTIRALNPIWTGKTALNHRSPYQIFGIPVGASLKEIQRAYRKLILKYHPDRNPGDAEAAEKFMAVQRAYEILLTVSRARETRQDNSSRGGVNRTCSEFKDDPFLFFYIAVKAHFLKDQKEEEPSSKPGQNHGTR
jgi:hypothetical protein